MSRKPQTDPQFHDASDPRCALHKDSREPARKDRACPKCLQERGFAAPGVPLEDTGRRRRTA
jgi:hypothetical protein